MIKNKEIEVICNMCEKKYKIDQKQYPQIYTEEHCDWMHQIDLSTPGYGSFLDTCKIEQIHLCDKCLKGFIQQMEIKPGINK